MAIVRLPPAQRLPVGLLPANKHLEPANGFEPLTCAFADWL